MSAREPGPHADAPQDPESAGPTGLDGAQATKGGIDAEPDPATAQAEHPETSPYVDSAAAGSIPFLDFGNKYGSIGASYSPQVLSGLSWGTIATDLSNPNSTVAKSVDGTANYITAAICSMTGNQPSSACTTTVRSLETQLRS
jgi:hypothetical protein